MLGTLSPFRALGGDERGELVRRQLAHLETLIDETLARFGPCEHGNVWQHQQLFWERLAER